MESRLGTAEEDHTDKDDQIHTLKEEIEHQNNTISNLSHEKKVELSLSKRLKKTFNLWSGVQPLVLFEEQA